MEPGHLLQDQSGVKGALTVARPTKYRDTTDFASMMRRMIRAHGRRVADGDIEDLAELIGLADELDNVIRDTIHHMRHRQEFSWAAIASATGVTRQAAQQRWGR